MLHNALYSQNSLKNFSSKIAWVWLTYIWPFLYYKKTILEWNSGNFWRKIFEGILWIRGIMEHQLRPPRGFVDIFNPFSLKNLESHTVPAKTVFWSLPFPTWTKFGEQIANTISYLVKAKWCRNKNQSAMHKNWLSHLLVPCWK